LSPYTFSGLGKEYHRNAVLGGAPPLTLLAFHKTAGFGEDALQFAEGIIE